VRAIVAGGGLAGLAAAWGLRRAGIDVRVLEGAETPGGDAAGFRDRGYAFDLVPQFLGPEDAEVVRLCEAWCGRPLLRGRRRVRILVDGRLYRHPPDGGDLLGSRALPFAAGILAGRLQRSLGGRGDEAPDYLSFLTARFGAPLCERFLAPIVEKIGGLPASEIASDVARAFLPRHGVMSQVSRRIAGGEEASEDLLYPEDGFMTIPEGMMRALTRAGVEVRLRHRVTGLHGGASRISEVVAEGPHGPVRFRADLVLSTLPVAHLLAALGPEEAPDARDAAGQIRTRCLIVVLLGVRRDRLTEEHEIFVPDPSVRFHRVSETINHAPRMAPRGSTGLCVEIACDRGDRLWREDDGTQVRRVIDDLCGLGFLRSTGEVEAGWVRRFPAAIPVMTLGHRALRERIDRDLGRFSNLRRCGREGGLAAGTPAARIREGIEAASRAASTSGERAA
jgi:protoporphyrinogen oxidase